MIVVSSLDHAEETFRTYAPGFVISILDQADPEPPAFTGLPPENHIILCEDCSRKDCQDAKQSRCAKILDVAERWRSLAAPRPPILIHCCKGVSRSMAVAYILICAIEKNRCEKDIARSLRQAAPHADPNLMLISEADALLERDDRMVDAILDLCPCCNAVDKPIITLPLAA